MLFRFPNQQTAQPKRNYPDIVSSRSLWSFSCLSKKCCSFALRRLPAVNQILISALQRLRLNWQLKKLGNLYLCCTHLQIVPQIQNVYLKSNQAIRKSRTESEQKDRKSLQISSWQIRIFKQGIKRSLEMVQGVTQEEQKRQARALNRILYITFWVFRVAIHFPEANEFIIQWK